MAEAQRDPKEYLYTGTFSQSTFQKACETEFTGVQKFNTASTADLMFLLGKVGADPRITDIRWSAYILATAFIESSHTVRLKTQQSLRGRRRGRATLFRSGVRSAHLVDELRGGGRGPGTGPGTPA